jgi:hypothetical protein
MILGYNVLGSNVFCWNVLDSNMSDSNHWALMALGCKVIGSHVFRL